MYLAPRTYWLRKVDSTPRMISSVYEPLRLPSTGSTYDPTMEEVDPASDSALGSGA